MVSDVCFAWQRASANDGDESFQGEIEIVVLSARFEWKIDLMLYLIM